MEISQYASKLVSSIKGNKSFESRLKSAKLPLLNKKIKKFINIVSKYNIQKNEFTLISFYFDGALFATSYWSAEGCRYASVGEYFGNKCYECNNVFLYNLELDLDKKLEIKVRQNVSKITYQVHGPVSVESNLLLNFAVRLLVLYESELSQNISQKLYPTTLGQITRIGDINYPVWRDIFVSTMLTDIVINGISPHFLICGGWTYIHGENAADAFRSQYILNRYMMTPQYESMCNTLYLLHNSLNEIDEQDVYDVQEKIRHTIHDINNNLRYSKMLMLSVVESSSEANIDEITEEDLFHIFHAFNIMHKVCGVVHTHPDISCIRFTECKENLLLVTPALKYLVKTTRLPHIVDFGESHVGDNFINYFRKYIKPYNVISNDIRDVNDKLMAMLSGIRIDRDAMYDAMLNDVDNTQYLCGMDYLIFLNQFPQHEELQQLVKKLFIKNINNMIAKSPAVDIYESILTFFNDKFLYNDNDPFDDVFDMNKNIEFSTVSSKHTPNIAELKSINFDHLDVDNHIMLLIDSMNMEAELS